MALQIFGQLIAHPAVTTSAPSGDAGINFATSVPYTTMKERKLLLTITVAGAASDIFVWGLLAKGTINDTSDDVWGLFQDMHKTAPLGKLATALPVGIYHFVIPDFGGFKSLYIQGSGVGTVTAQISPIQETPQA